MAAVPSGLSLTPLITIIIIIITKETVSTWFHTEYYNIKLNINGPYTR
jgi:hypothetical protein